MIRSPFSTKSSAGLAVYEDERGVTLVELLVAMVLMFIVIGATLETFNENMNVNRVNQIQNESQERNRVAIDRMARELRNAAVPRRDAPVAILRAEAYDLVFRTSDADGGNPRLVRYCLGAESNGAESLILHTAPTGAAAPGAACSSTVPGLNWTTGTVVARNVVNRRGGANRPVWTMNSTVPTEITQIVTRLFVDVNPGERPGESNLATGVFLRNQGRAPVADFSLESLAGGRAMVEASNSYDPDGEPLTYLWYLGVPPATGCSQSAVTALGRGTTHTYQGLPVGNPTLGLKVCDPSGLEATAIRQVGADDDDDDDD